MSSAITSLWKVQQTFFKVLVRNRLSSSSSLKKTLSFHVKGQMELAYCVVQLKITFQNKGSMYNEEYCIKNGILKNVGSMVCTQQLARESTKVNY